MTRSRHASADRLAATTETLRCIYCQRTVMWPLASLYPSRCLYCGRACGYTTEAGATE